MDNNNYIITKCIEILKDKIPSIELVKCLKGIDKAISLPYSIHNNETEVKEIFNNSFNYNEYNWKLIDKYLKEYLEEKEYEKFTNSEYYCNIKLFCKIINSFLNVFNDSAIGVADIETT